MNKYYSDPSDPYGITTEYTAQSADQDFKKKPHKAATGEVRGNTVLTPRSIPTQAEADAVARRG